MESTRSKFPRNSVCVQKELFPYNVPFYYFVLTGKFFSWHPAWWRWRRERKAREKHGNRMRENVVLSPSLSLRKLHHWSSIDDSKFTMSLHPPTRLPFIVSSSFSSSSMLSFSYIFLFSQMKMLIFIRFACFFLFLLWEKRKRLFFGGRKKAKEKFIAFFVFKGFFPLSLYVFNIISFDSISIVITSCCLLLLITKLGCDRQKGKHSKI